MMSPRLPKQCHCANIWCSLIRLIFTGTFIDFQESHMWHNNFNSTKALDDLYFVNSSKSSLSLNMVKTSQCYTAFPFHFLKPFRLTRYKKKYHTCTVRSAGLIQRHNSQKQHMLHSISIFPDITLLSVCCRPTYPWTLCQWRPSSNPHSQPTHPPKAGYVSSPG